MALKANSMVVALVAWNTQTNSPQTGDASNISTYWVKDGTSTATTNSVTEVDATNCPGVYKVTLTATETTCTYGILAGKSSTSNVSIMPTSIAFEDLDYLTTKASLIGTSIVVNTPVNASTNQVTIIQGDDYSANTGNRLHWTSSDWVDLTGSSAVFGTKKLRGGTTGNLSSVAVTYANEGASSQDIYVTLTDTQTAAMAVGTDAYEYSVVCTLTGGEKVTLARGFITVLDDIT